MKILVTGGSGYLGTHVRGFFSADDFSRRSGLDVLDLHDVKAVGDYDLVIHLAAHLDKAPDADEEVFLTNVEGTINVLQNIRKDAVFIFASTKDVYGRFADGFAEVPESCQTLYAGQSALEWSKLIAEKFVEYYSHRNGFRACIFRLSTPYAPLTAGNEPNFVGYFANAINLGERIRLAAGGTPVRDLVHVDDFSAACNAFVESALARGLYNLGGGRENAVSLSGLVEKLEEVSGLQAVVNKDEAGGPPVPLNYVSDLTLISQELGWKPKIGLDEGLRTLFR